MSNERCGCWMLRREDSNLLQYSGFILAAQYWCAVISYHTWLSDNTLSQGNARSLSTGLIFIHAVPSLYWSTVLDTSGAEHWISFFWPSWKFCRSNCTSECFLLFASEGEFWSIALTLMLPLNGIIPPVSLEEHFVTRVHLDFFLRTSTFSAWWSVFP